MKTKSDVSVLSLSLEDPASNDGMIRISEKLIPFVPSYPSGINQKVVVFGDQGYVERGRDFPKQMCAPPPSKRIPDFLVLIFGIVYT